MQPKRHVLGVGGLVAMLAAASVLAACGGDSSSSSATHWSHLVSVKVTTARPGLPPPGGTPKTTTFAPPLDSRTAQDALNAHHIAKADHTTQSNGCAGGTEVDFVIEQASGKKVHLHSYLCGGHQFGSTSGDVQGFLDEFHLS